MSPIFEIVLFESNSATAHLYAAAFQIAGLRLFSAAYAQSLQEIFEKPGFDGLYWPLAMGEQWNIKPINDVIQVVETDEALRQRGWSNFLLLGLALSEENSVSVQRGFAVWSRAILTALSTDDSRQLTRVKVPADLIHLSELTPQRASEILHAAERDFNNDIRS